MVKVTKEPVDMLCDRIFLLRRQIECNRWMRNSSNS